MVKSRKPAVSQSKIQETAWHRYIVDFYCPEKKLVIEIDGDSHVETIDDDAQRTSYLQFLGYKVLRYSNSDVLNNISGVFENLLEKIINLGLTRFK